MKKANNDIDYALIGKYLDGEATPAEIRKVEKWINRSKENQAEYNRFRILWDQTESMTASSKAPVNVDRAWLKLSTRIRNAEPVSAGRMKEKSGMKSGRRFTDYLLRIAAAMVVAVGLYLIYQQLIRPTAIIDVVAENEIHETTLPDQTAITLNENSTLTYPEKFDREKRMVELKGEAFFEVKRNVKKPFVIQVPDAVIEVLGTSFNVRALENEPEVTVTVRDGKVMLSDKEDIAYVVLEAHEKGILNRETGHIEKYISTDENEMFWKTRTLIFRDTQLSSVFATLEKVFNVKIIIENESVKSCHLTAKFQDQDIDEILANIAISFDLTVRKKNSSFEISGDGC
jgi:transmembrane sensor